MQENKNIMEAVVKNQEKAWQYKEEFRTQNSGFGIFH